MYLTFWKKCYMFKELLHTYHKTGKCWKNIGRAQQSKQTNPQSGACSLPTWRFTSQLKPETTEMSVIPITVDENVKSPSDLRLNSFSTNSSSPVFFFCTSCNPYQTRLIIIWLWTRKVRVKQTQGKRLEHTSDCTDPTLSSIYVNGTNSSFPIHPA